MEDDWSGGLYRYISWITVITKGHSRSPCPQKNAHNFSLKYPNHLFTRTIFI